MNSLIVRQVSIGTRNLAILKVGVPVAANIVLKGGQTSTIAFCNLQRPYKTPGIDPTALMFLYYLSLRLPEDFNLFKISLIRFSLLN